MKNESIKKIIKKLPDAPGVYKFKNADEIIYIGKATSLRNRVKSYMSKRLFDTRGPVIVKMLEEFNKIEYIKTDSVLEALILEAELIKKYQPKYNTKDKSDKSFNYIIITKDKLPKVIIVRGSNLKNFERSFVFGPYTNGGQLKEALKIIRRIFPYLDDKFKNNYHFYRQVELVPDISNIDGINKYKKDIKNLKLFFQGKKKIVLRNLMKEMKEYAKKHEFEKAGENKRQIFALKHINDIALLKNNPDSVSSHFSSLRPSRSTEWDPRERKTERDYIRIEAYDIAHMGGKNMVGVMTVVENNQAVKSEYKKFKIRTQAGANDTGALAEVLDRRLAHKEWVYPDLIVVDGGMAQLNVAKKVLMKVDIKIPIVSVVKDEKHKAKNILLSPRPDPKIHQDGAQGLAFMNKYKSAILLANSEAHRFAIAYHKNMRGKNFLNR